MIIYLPKIALMALALAATPALAASTPLSQLGSGQIVGLTLEQSKAEVSSTLPSLGAHASITGCAPLTDVPNKERVLCVIEGATYAKFNKIPVDQIEVVFNRDTLAEVYLKFRPKNEEAKSVRDAIRKGLKKNLSQSEIRVNKERYVAYYKGPYTATFFALEDAPGANGGSEITAGYMVNNTP